MGMLQSGAKAIRETLSSLTDHESDDPAATVTALRTHGELPGNSQYTTNSADTLGWLSSADGKTPDGTAFAVTVTTANTTYQAALQTTASLGQMSLLDFLR
jgi:flagellin-like hook-associated protein FlgL